MGFLNTVLNSVKHWMADFSLFRQTAALLNLLSFIAVSNLCAKLVVRILDKMESKTQNLAGRQAVKLLQSPMRLLFIVLGLSISMNLLKLSPNTKLFVGHIIRSLIVLSVFWAIYRNSHLLSQLCQKIFIQSNSEVDSLVFIIINNSIRVIVIFITCTVLLQEWGYNIAGLLTGLGLGGLAFALAAKDTASNLFGGIILMIDKPFSIGDWIFTSRVEGIVEDIGLRSTRVRTFEQALVTIPNTIISGEPVTNYSRMNKRKISFKLGFSYEASSALVMEYLKKIRMMLESHEEVYGESVTVYLEKLGDEKIEVLVSLFVKSMDTRRFLEVQEEINFRVLGVLEEVGIWGSIRLK